MHQSPLCPSCRQISGRNVRSPKKPDSIVGVSNRDNWGRHTAPDSAWEENLSTRSKTSKDGWGWGVHFFQVPNGTGKDRKKGRLKGKLHCHSLVPNASSFMYMLISHFYFLNFIQKTLLRTHSSPFPALLINLPAGRGKISEHELDQVSSELKPSSVLRREHTSLKYPSRPCASGASWPLSRYHKPHFPFLSGIPAPAAFLGSSNTSRDFCMCCSLCLG